MLSGMMKNKARACSSFAMLCTVFVFLSAVSSIHTKPVAAPVVSATPVVDPRTSPMTFRAYQECSGNGCPYFVLAQGVITPATPRAFRQFLASEKYQPVVYFDSPGGSLSAALELGFVIRARGLDTYVGGPYEAFEGFAGPAREITRTLARRGICFSACAYAFLGGVSRELNEGGNYGVHRFYSGGRPLGDATTQVAMTILSSYLDEMGVDRRLLDLASLTPSEKLSSLPLAVARRLLVDNTAPELAPWTLDTTPKGKLFAYVVQRQPRRAATVSFLIARSNSGLVGTIVYKIKQKFRSADEIDAVFLEEAKDFAENVGPVTLAGVGIHVTAIWTGKSSEGYSLRFRLDASTVESMLAQTAFEFDPGFPRAYSDVSPQVTFSSEKLRQSLLALSR